MLTATSAEYNFWIERLPFGSAEMCVLIPVDICLLPKQTALWDGRCVPFTVLIHFACALTSNARSLPLQFNNTPHHKSRRTVCTSGMKQKSSQNEKGQHELIVAIPANPPTRHTPSNFYAPLLHLPMKTDRSLDLG